MRFLDHFPFGKTVDTTQGIEDGTEKIDKVDVICRHIIINYLFLDAV